MIDPNGPFEEVSAFIWTPDTNKMLEVMTIFRGTHPNNASKYVKSFPSGGIIIFRSRNLDIIEVSIWYSGFFIAVFIVGIKGFEQGVLTTKKHKSPAGFEPYSSRLWALCFTTELYDHVERECFTAITYICYCCPAYFIRCMDL